MRGQLVAVDEQEGELVGVGEPFIWPHRKSCQAPNLWKTPQTTQTKRKINFQKLEINCSNLSYLNQSTKERPPTRRAFCISPPFRRSRS